MKWPLFGINISLVSLVFLLSRVGATKEPEPVHSLWKHKEPVPE